MRYSVKDVFQYTGVSKIRIFWRILLLSIYKVLRVRWVTVPVNSYKMKLDLATPGLSRVLFIYGKRELLDTYVVMKEVAENSNVLEAGANIGYYTLLEANQTSGKIYALEPDPRNIELLRENISLNNFSDRIEVSSQGASNANEIKAFNLGDRTNISSFVDSTKNVGTHKVQCVRLDELPYISSIDFIRMDVEGYECKVLQGLERVVRSDQPLKIFIEIHYGAYNESELNFKTQMQHLLDNGFRVQYVIANTKKRSLFKERSYVPIRTETETRYTRDLYENISNEDANYFFDKGILRSILFTR